ncbi:MAG: hypothetical protein J6B56_06025 [Clostridia bacterium]|nr:hypothetical protein [Clostridia bacterium]
MEKFAIGLLLGGVCGALLTANNYKMRTLVRKGQEEVQNKLDELIDEKLCAFEEKDEKTTDKEKKEDGKARKSRAEK